MLAPDTHERDNDRLHYQKIMQRVSALPEAQRNTVFLVYVEGFTYQEAADTLSVPIGTIMSRLAAARGTLAKSADTPAPAKEKLS
ncbi:putative RNA polymerase sigma factor [Pectobacterium atrosepticum ICMP 1526]|nr:putative RNA polymerase sigma factor [Pectobacterium atrosepticum ICMP 1526]